MQYFSKLISGLVNVRSSICMMLMLAVVFTPASSKADERAIGNFTSSISKVYSASKSCEHTIGPGPKEYMELIATYFMKLYPNGASYWVVPGAVQIISDPATCIRLMQTKLHEYRSARMDYRNNYPNRNPPPILIAYQWWDNDFEEPATESPSKSYIPAAKAPKIKQKFQQQSSLQ